MLEKKRSLRFLSKWGLGLGETYGSFRDVAGALTCRSSSGRVRMGSAWISCAYCEPCCSRRQNQHGWSHLNALDTTAWMGRIQSR